MSDDWSISPSSPLMGTMLTSVGEHERNRIMRNYYPFGDPYTLNAMAAFAQKYGLQMPAYTTLTGHMYDLWSAPQTQAQNNTPPTSPPPAFLFGAESQSPHWSQKPIVLMALGGAIAALLIFLAVKKKAA